MTKSFYTQRPASSAERMTSETQDAKEVEVRDSWWVWRVVASKKWVQEIDEEQNVLKQHVQKVESVLNQHVQNVDNLTKSNAMELSTKLQETQSTHSHLAAQIKNVDASCQKHIEDLNRWVSCTRQRLNWVEGGDMMSQLHKGFAKLDKGLETIDQKIGEYNKIQLDITHKLTIQKEMVKKQLQTWDSPDAASTLKRQLSDEIDRKIKPLKDSVEQALEKLQKIEDGQKRLERIDEIEDDMKEKWTLVEAVQTSVEIEFPKITQLEKGMQSLKAEVAGLKTLEATMASRAFVQTLQANLESQLEELKVKTSCREAHEDQQASLPHQLQKQLKKMEGLEAELQKTESLEADMAMQKEQVEKISGREASAAAQKEALEALKVSMTKHAKQLQTMESLEADLSRQLGTLKVSMTNQEKKQLQKTESLEADMAMQKEQVEKISGLEASAAAQKEVLEALKVSMTKHAKQLQTMESLEADLSRQKKQLGTLKVSMTNQEKKQLQKTESLETNVAMQKEQVEKISGLEASAAAQKEVLEALKVSMTKHATQLQTMESLEADVSRQKEQLGTLKVSMTNQEKKQLQKTESLEADMAMQKEQVEKISGRLEAEVAAQQGLQQQLDKVKTAVKKQEQQARLSNPGTDPRSAAVESVDLKSKFDLWMQNSNLPRQLEKLKQGLLARLSKLEDALEPLEMERLTGMERTIQQEVLPQLQHLQIRIESLGRGPPQADGGSRGSSSPRFTQTTQPQVCRLSVSLLSGREARIDITSQMRIAALKDAAERELECSIYALFKEERRLDLDKSVGEAQLQDGDALQAVVGQAKAFCGFTWPEKPQDLNSLHRTLSVEQQLHAARDSDESVEQRSKLVKTVQLELHPDKGGTDEAQIWLKEWLKEHLEWFFEPHQVPETLRRKYQGDETV
ncbi:unnamed protein product [Durusdinium trenchii]|uniref:Uncharacterized protein n=1 Tax=Durusdinium trenchii TaxID=1381693 RepID=A0ABP0RJ66_9DINO